MERIVLFSGIVAKISSTNLPNEQRIACEDSVVHIETDRVIWMSGCMENMNHEIAQRKFGAVTDSYSGIRLFVTKQDGFDAG